MAAIASGGDTDTGYNLDELYEDGGVGGPLNPNREAISSTDYKTKVVLDLFFSGLGAGDFYAGKPITGCVKLVSSILANTILFKGALTPVFSCLSLFQNTSGNYIAGDGLKVRQVVQLHPGEISPIDHTASLLAFLCLGVLGGHQFYAGKPFKGVAMLCTFGGLGLWALINAYELATCQFKDGNGKVICPNYIKIDNGVNPFTNKTI